MQPSSLVVPCSSCGTLNRVPRARLQEAAICADCQTPLFGQPPATLTTMTFDRFVGRSDLPVLVDFWAPWCGPCRTMAPHFAQAATRLARRALLAKLDTEQHPEPAHRFAIQSIPTLVRFDHGREVDRHIGAMPADAIVTWFAP